ncbi:alpha/beta hydrolase fold domain-containing protein [Streptomyces sennicomposti]
MTETTRAVAPDARGRLGVDTARIAVMGESAGGILAVTTALRARRDGIGLARQILV